VADKEEDHMRIALSMTMVALLAAALVSCGGDDKKPDDSTGEGDEPKPLSGKAHYPKVEGDAEAAEFVGKAGRTLLVTQSRFKADEKGKYTVPDAGVLLLLTPAKGKWKVEQIEDTESNVYHKALQYGDEGILTLGANEAKLKLWNKDGGEWKAEVLWHPTFGGEHNRLRDAELADFDGDGRQDLAIATHDQGVIAVIWRKESGWEAQEIDRKADTFVHEIEVGDLDGDGNLEFYSTPSQPNTASGAEQGGRIMRYAWTGEKFEASEVVSLETRHMKEILVADVEGDGKQELYAAVEAEVGEGGKIKQPVEIRRFDWKGGKFEATTVVEIADRLCRFLIAGDLDGDGKSELIAAAFTAGVWVVEKDGESWNKTCIDEKSGGFEHAAYLADMNGDQKLELYVADDRGGAVRQYIFSSGSYDTKVVSKRLVPAQAMVWNITVADL
jgi:hypothetical protein